jgi:plastocyanin
VSDVPSVSSPPVAVPAGPIVIVDCTATGFVPSSITIAPGTTVEWDNPDHLNHYNITSGTNSDYNLQFGQGYLDMYVPYFFEFDVPGTYPYSDMHDGFEAVIIVQ